MPERFCCGRVRGFAEGTRPQCAESRRSCLFKTRHPPWLVERGGAVPERHESLEDTLRYLADRIATGVPGLFVPTPAHLEPYRLEAIRKATGEGWSDDDEEDAG
jgi:hypothetical protein